MCNEYVGFFFGDAGAVASLVLAVFLLFMFRWRNIHGE